VTIGHLPSSTCGTGQVCIIGRKDGTPSWLPPNGSGTEGRGRAVKKLLLVVLAALGGYFVYRQVQADRAEQDLWTEATDAVPVGAR
jgi:hypothetical protein